MLDLHNFALALYKEKFINNSQPKTLFTMKSLCFDEAQTRFEQGLITQEHYLSHCLAHFAGTRHPQCQLRNRSRSDDHRSSPLWNQHQSFKPQSFLHQKSLDHLTSSIHDAALHEIYIPLQGAPTVLLLFATQYF